MNLRRSLVAASALSLIAAGAVCAENIVIATVNNGDMIRMQGLTEDFTAKTGHTVEWVTLEENILRERVRRSERVAAVEPVDAELGDTRRGPGLAIAGSGSIREASPALEGAAEVVDG